MSKLMPLPAVNFGKKVAKAESVGAPGRLQWIPVANLRIDSAYQREVGDRGVKNIRKIVETFAWRKFSPLVVAPREGGVYAVIDGQHRAIAAKLHGGMTQLPCPVITCSPREEADAFSTINVQVTRVHSQAIFKAKVAASDPAALAAEKCASAAGVRILPYPVDAKSIAPNETMACAEIERLCTFYGPKLTGAALRVVMRAARGQRGMLRAFVIRAVCLMLFENSDWQGRLEDVGDALGAAGIPKLMERAVRENSAVANHKTIAGCLSAIMVESVSKRIDKKVAA